MDAVCVFIMLNFRLLRIVFMLATFFSLRLCFLLLNLFRACFSGHFFFSFLSSTKCFVCAFTNVTMRSMEKSTGSNLKIFALFTKINVCMLLCVLYGKMIWYGCRRLFSLLLVWCFHRMHRNSCTILYSRVYCVSTQTYFPRNFHPNNFDVCVCVYRSHETVHLQVRKPREKCLMKMTIADENSDSSECIRPTSFILYVQHFALASHATLIIWNAYKFSTTNPLSHPYTLAFASPLNWCTCAQRRTLHHSHKHRANLYPKRNIVVVVGALCWQRKGWKITIFGFEFTSTNAVRHGASNPRIPHRAETSSYCVYVLLFFLFHR